MVIEKMLERATNSQLLSVFALAVITLSIYTFWGGSYIKSVLLSLRLSGPPSLPFLGNCLLIKEKDLMRNRAANAFDLYGSLVRIWVLLFPFFVVLQPEDLQVILSSKKHTSKVFFYRLMHNFLGDGLITSSGPKWDSHRKLIQPAFHLNLLEKFIGTFVDASQSLYENLDASSDGNEINIAKYVNNCVVDILNEAVLGVPIKKKDLINMMDSPFRQGKLIMPQRFLQPWLLLDGIYHWTKMATDELTQKKRLNDFTRQMIKRRREIMANGGNGLNNNNERKCLLDYMIEISDNPDTDFTEEDIVNEACTFMLAGQDSVGAAVAFTIFLLAQNSECQEKCHEEIVRIFEYSNRAPTMSDLREMRYMEMCIKEALRLYPSVPLIARKLGEEVRLGAHTLPAGSNIFICPYATHRLAHIFPEPEKFKPERFSPENSENRHPYAFLPFSAGPRYCIGNRFAIMEIKTIVSRLLRSYQLQPVPGKTTFEAIYRITLRASGGLWVRLKPREHQITDTEYAS
ncbi:probable cytochrome P450 4aa1 [Scaptodrosophila lebanonensis]|uniref:Probable cytochrome P450 4aa1 n=1 Tax=Drosophila lebanonensis TaxID=7225 RepID=A0A6J2UGX7_DROLE|nr:probable cytochrome P450 4aa1 [Scaptodrosophila lebanonensis]